MRKMIAMLAVLSLIFFFVDLYLIVTGSFSPNRLIPFLPTLYCLMWAIGIWKAEKCMNEHFGNRAEAEQSSYDGKLIRYPARRK